MATSPILAKTDKELADELRAVIVQANGLSTGLANRGILVEYTTMAYRTVVINGEAIDLTRLDVKITKDI